MKRLTLDETWVLCLKMWKWITQQRKKNNREHARILKRRWAENHGYHIDKLENDCFFCEYAARHNKEKWIRDCSFCPAVKIDPQFHCANDDYSWHENPIAFYAKLVELNKIRLKKKRKQ